MNEVRFWRGAFALSLPTLAVLATGCSSPPSQLYVLNSAVGAPQNLASAETVVPASVPSTYPGSRSRLISVVVTVPDYLDRLDIVERIGANELKPNYSAQWGERLATTATRAVAENLIVLLPSDEVLMLTASGHRTADYQVSLDFIQFESDASGQAIATGRWSIADRDGTERMSGRVKRSEPATDKGYAAMAAAMSRNLAAISRDIAARLENTPADRTAAINPLQSDRQQAKRQQPAQ